MEVSLVEDKLTVPPTSVGGERDDRGEGDTAERGDREEEGEGRGEERREREGKKGGGPYSSSTPSYVDLAENLALRIWKMQLTREYIRGQNKS